MVKSIIVSQACPHLITSNRYQYPTCHEQVGQIITEVLSELLPDGKWISNCYMLQGKGKQVSKGTTCHEPQCIPDMAIHPSSSSNNLTAMQACLKKWCCIPSTVLRSSRLLAPRTTVRSKRKY